MLTTAERRPGLRPVTSPQRGRAASLRRTVADRNRSPRCPPRCVSYLTRRIPALPLTYDRARCTPSKSPRVGSDPAPHPSRFIFANARRRRVPAMMRLTLFPDGGTYPIFDESRIASRSCDWRVEPRSGLHAFGPGFLSRTVALDITTYPLYQERALPNNVLHGYLIYEFFCCDTKVSAACIRSSGD
jgi:hypothetical protein